MLSRPYLRYGWLHLQPGDWGATLDRQIEERDRLDDISHSGPAPAFVACVDEQQMPKQKTEARDVFCCHANPSASDLERSLNSKSNHPY